MPCNLAWKLRLVLRGDADAALLDSYEIERKPHVRAVVASAKEFGKIIGELDPVAAAERDLRLRAELKAGTAETIRQKFIPDLVSGLIAPDADLAGRLFVQPHVRAPDGRMCRLDELLKPEFAIVTLAAQQMAWLSEASALAGSACPANASSSPRRVKAATRTASSSVVERDGLFADWMRQHGVAAAIVRPDRYVFGAARSAEQLNMLVERLIRRARRKKAACHFLMSAATRT